MKHYQKPHINKAKTRSLFIKHLKSGNDPYPLLILYFKPEFLIRLFAGYEVLLLGPEKGREAAKQYDSWFNGGEKPTLLPSVLFEDNAIKLYLDSMKGNKGFINFIIPILSRYIPNFT